MSARDPRPAQVQRVGDDYVVTGVALGADPMIVPTIAMRIRRHTLARAPRDRRWCLEIGGEVYVYAKTLRLARLDASMRAFALDEVPSTPSPVTVHSGADQWMVALRAYVTGVFRGRFPSALHVGAVFDERHETWRVTVTHSGDVVGLWTMEIGSDDEKFRFRDSRRMLVTFPIPEEL